MSSLESHTMVPTATMLGRVAGPWWAGFATALEGTADAVATLDIIPTFLSGCARDPPLRGPFSRGCRGFVTIPTRTLNSRVVGRPAPPSHARVRRRLAGGEGVR